MPQPIARAAERQRLGVGFGRPAPPGKMVFGLMIAGAAPGALDPLLPLPFDGAGFGAGAGRCRIRRRWLRCWNRFAGRRGLPHRRRRLGHGAAATRGGARFCCRWNRRRRSTYFERRQVDDRRGVSANDLRHRRVRSRLGDVRWRWIGAAVARTATAGDDGHQQGDGQAHAEPWRASVPRQTPCRHAPPPAARQAPPRPGVARQRLQIGGGLRPAEDARSSPERGDWRDRRGTVIRGAI